MLIDARGVDDGAIIPADLCIIGGGAAGITLALEFINKPVQVVLLESGGTTPDAATQSLYAGESVGITWYAGPENSRSRYLGGSTNCWGGWCRPLSAIDFEQRPWIADSGWPFTRAELDPYYPRANEILQLGPYDYTERYWAPKLAEHEVWFLPVQGPRIENVVNQFSPPARLGEIYRPNLQSSANVRVFLHANATELETNRTGSRVETVHVATLNGVKFTVVPKMIVLCTGGIENARLLLVSNRVQPNGIGNGYDLVGRYYTDHPRLTTNRIRLSDQRRHRRLYDKSLGLTRRMTRMRGMRIAAHIAPTESFQREHALPNSRTYFVAKYFDQMSPAVYALKRINQQLDDRRKFGLPITRLLKEIVRGLPVILRRAPLIPLAVLDNYLNPEFISREFFTETVIEPIPNRDSRVTLSEARDRLGMNQVRVDWRLSEQDKQNFLTTHRVVQDEMVRQGLVTVCDEKEDPAAHWPSGLMGCWHHMGTTRMHPDPRKGVVDAECRVHGVANLYIAGSSVFPTFGSDIPTMTIVALALRLSRTILPRLRDTAKVAEAEDTLSRRPRRAAPSAARASEEP